MMKTPLWRTVHIVTAVLLAAVLGVGAGQLAGAQGLLPGWSSYDDDIAKANQDKANQAAEQARLTSELAETDAAIAQATLRLNELNAQLPGVRAEYEAAKESYDAAVAQQTIIADKLAAAIAEDEQLTKDIAAGAEEIADLQAAMAQMARTTYQASQESSSLAIMLGAQDSSEFVREYAYRDTVARVQSTTLTQAEELAAVNRNRESRQVAVRGYIEELKVEADALVAQTELARVAAEEAKVQVETLVAEAQELANYLEAQREVYLAQQAELEAAQAALAVQLEDLWKKKLAEEAINGSGKLEKGFLSPPTEVPYITSSYGYRIHPVYGYRKLHAGTDFRAYCGTPILASADGVVEWAKLLTGFGNQVMLDHGVVSGKVVFTSYNHLTSFAVSPGQKVKRGDVVGYSGTTGTSTACHLHFEVYVNGQTVDPMLYVADF